MIVWCAYCQTFQGEVPPYSQSTVSHGMCEPCSRSNMEWSDEEAARIQSLAALHRRFWQAGRNGDAEALEALAERGIRAGVRPLDMLFGFAAPALTKVGELWANNELTIEDEHRFTRSCESLATLVERQASVDAAHAELESDVEGSVLLARVEGNTHTLGIRFARLGLMSLGIRSHVLVEDATAERLLEQVLIGKHPVVGLSVALPCQAKALQRAIDTLLGDARFKGRIVVAGGVINEGLTLPVDSSRVHFLVRTKFDETVAPLFRA